MPPDFLTQGSAAKPEVHTVDLSVESSSRGQTYKYWIVHTNTGDKTVRPERSAVEISSVPGVRLGEGFPSSVGPGKTVSFDLRPNLSVAAGIPTQTCNQTV